MFSIHIFSCWQIALAPKPYILSKLGLTCFHSWDYNLP